MDYKKQQPFRTTNFVFGLSLLLALGGWGLYAYLFHSVAKIGQSTALLTSETHKLELQQSQVTELNNNLTANQAREPILVSYFVDASDPVPLFQTLEGYGVSTSVAVKINTVDIKKSPDRVLVTLAGQGSFTNIYRFLGLVEAAPYEFTIANASVHAVPGTQASTVDPKSKGAGTLWEAQVTLSITSVTGVAGLPVSK